MDLRKPPTYTRGGIIVFDVTWQVALKYFVSQWSHKNDLPR